MFRIDQSRTNAYGTTTDTDLVPGLISEQAAVQEAIARQRDAIERCDAIAVSTVVYQWDSQKLQRLVHREDSALSSDMPRFVRNPSKAMSWDSHVKLAEA